jgi:hypothetical protein
MNTIQVDCCKEVFIETKKIETQTTSENRTSREQEDNNKKKTTQTKINNTRNEHNTSGLLQRNVYKFF